jgi:hypothetical protein
VPENDEDIVRLLRKRMSRAELGKQGLVRMSYAVDYPLERDARLALSGLTANGYEARIVPSEVSGDKSFVVVAEKATPPEAVPAGIRWLKKYAKKSNGSYRSWGAPELHG